MSEYVISASTLGVISLILVLGLNVTWGWSGQLNLSYYAFVALGAYLTGVFNLPPHGQDVTYILGLNLPFLASISLAVASCAILGAALGAILTRRLEGYYLAIGSVSAALIFYTVVDQSPSLFNGPVGIYGVGEPLNSYLKLNFTDYSALYLGMCIAILSLVFLVTFLLQRSPFGRALRTTREDPISSAVFGHAVYALRIKAFILSSAIAGLGGGLLLFYVTAFNPSGWSTAEVILLFAAILVGGSGNNLGVLIGGALILSIFPQALLQIPGMESHATLAAPIGDIIDGAAIMVTIWLRPNGLLPERKVLAPERGVQQSRVSSFLRLKADS
jgi:branched-chain amino acid transport system permease protein